MDFSLDKLQVLADPATETGRNNRCTFIPEMIGLCLEIQAEAL